MDASPLVWYNYSVLNPKRTMFNNKEGIQLQIEALREVNPAKSRAPSANVARRLHARLAAWIRHRSDLRIEIGRLEREITVKARLPATRTAKGGGHPLTPLQKREFTTFLTEIGSEFALTLVERESVDSWAMFALILPVQPQGLH